jgi:ATP-binding cassette subfamily C (CFTR/MRP) protein 1
MSVQPEQHITVCSCLGSSNTSLILCLLQMMNLQNGHITIDGINISMLTCVDLHLCINVMPQDPFLMPGTIRFNIDPFVVVSDDKTIHALE